MHAGVQLIPGLHTVADCGFVRFLRRRLGQRGRGLVSYFEPKGSRWVIGVWSNQVAGRVVELMAFKDERELTVEHVQEIRFNLNNPLRIGAIKAWVRRQWDEQRAQLRWQEDQERRRQDYREYAKKQSPMADPKDPRWLAYL